MSWATAQPATDTSLWQLNDDNGDVDMILFIHTDDGKVGYKDEARYNNFLDALKSKFKIGFAKIGIDRIFNIKVEHRRQMIRLSQQKYIQDLLTQYNVVEDPKVTAPMSTSYQLVQRTDQLSEKEMELMRERPFLSLLSALLWVARCTRPDILLSLTLLARASSNPDPTHWRALIKVLKYLQNTIAWCIQLRPINLTDPQLVQFSDASHANDHPTGRSITGNFTLLDGNLLDWACKHQPYVTLHSGEAETVAASTGCTHIQYWQQLLEPLLGKIDTSHYDVPRQHNCASEPYKSDPHYSHETHSHQTALRTRTFCSRIDYWHPYPRNR